MKIKDQGIRDYLAIPNRIARVKIPIKMDNGKIRVFIGFRSQHNNDEDTREEYDTLIQLEE